MDSEPHAGSIIINETSNDVRGTYPLHGSISIYTVSGNIDISLIICTAEQSGTQIPVTITLTTVSGSITVSTLDLSDIAMKGPRKVFRSGMKTTSGSIKAELPHSTSTDISTTSGNLSVVLHPVNPTTRSNIYLNNVSGTTNLSVYPSLVDPPAPICSLSTTMKSISGNANLTYPLNWEGEIECITISGDTQWDWPGLSVSRTGTRMYATKGNGDGKLWVEGKSMNVKLWGRAYEVGYTGSDGRREMKEPTAKDGRQGSGLGESQRMPGGEAGDRENDSRRGDEWQEEDPPPSYKEATMM
ncbi:MAG: hypothetical protein Q9217_004979 [Psora testacea]